MNQVSYKNFDKSLYEMWKCQKPNLNFLRVWGYLAKVGVPPIKKRKLGSKILNCVFIGYAHHSVAYRFLIIKSEINRFDNNAIIKYREAIFKKISIL